MPNFCGSLSFSWSRRSTNEAKFPFEDFPRAHKSQFTRSANERHLTMLADYICSSVVCATRLLSIYEKGTVPYIVSCGHYYCQNCADNLTACNLCTNNTTPTTKFADLMLNGIFDDMRKNGFKCEAGCNKIHPRYDSVLYEVSGPNPIKKFYCVWCATGMNGAGNEAMNKPVKLIPQSEIPQHTVRRLPSLDCTRKDIGCIFVECCFCAQKLVDSGDKHLRLECGHICHKGCFPKHWPRNCKMCPNSVYRESDMLTKALHTSLPMHLMYSYDPDKKQKCTVCRKFHPEENVVGGEKCVWCTVSKMII